MPYTITWESKGILRTFRGRVSSAEFAHAQAEMYGDPRFESARYALIDFSAVTELAYTPGDVEEITASNRGAYLTNPNLQVAVVTTDGGMQALLAKMKDISAYPLFVFGTMDDARRWLASGG